MTAGKEEWVVPGGRVGQRAAGQGRRWRDERGAASTYLGREGLEPVRLEEGDIFRLKYGIKHGHLALELPGR